MKNLAIIFSLAILAGCSGMRSSGAGTSGATSSGGGYGSSAWGFSPNSSAGMGSQNALEGPVSGLTWQR